MVLGITRLSGGGTEGSGDGGCDDFRRCRILGLCATCHDRCPGV